MERSHLQRAKKSIRVLTTKLIKLMKNTEGIIDIRQASAILSLSERQKRRVYDIINVLEGIGVLQKDRDTGHWKFAANHKPLYGTDKKLANLKKLELLRQLKNLKQREKLLDHQQSCIKDSLKNLTQDSNAAKYLYVTKDDISKFDDANTVLIVNAPPDTTSIHLQSLEVPSRQQNFLQLTITSSSIPISANIYLRNNGSEDSENCKSTSTGTEWSSDVPHIHHSAINVPENMFLKLTPMDSKRDYKFSLSATEGVCDVFD